MQGQRGLVKLRGNVAGLQDMAQILKQPVGDIDRCVRDPGNRKAERQARLRPFERGPGISEYVRIQRKRARQHAAGDVGGTELAGDPDVVVQLRSIAPQYTRRINDTEHGDAQRDVVQAARGVAADQRARMEIGQRVEARRKAIPPLRIDARKAEPEHTGERRGAHGSQIRQVDRKRLVAERPRIDIGEKMAALQQQIGAGRKPLAGRDIEKRAVVSSTDHAGGDSTHERTCNQFEFRQVGHASVPVNGRVNRGPLAACRARPDFGRAGLGGELIQHAVDELEPVCAAEGLGKLHSLVDGDPIRNFDVVHELESSDEQDAVLDR